MWVGGDSVSSALGWSGAGYLQRDAVLLRRNAEELEPTQGRARLRWRAKPSGRYNVKALERHNGLPARWFVVLNVTHLIIFALVLRNPSHLPASPKGVLWKETWCPE